jgi:hypothetical protein
MPHSPTRWPPYGRPETSRLLKVDHYFLHVRILIRPSQYAAPLRTLIPGEGSQEFMGRLIAERTAVQTLMCVRADLSRCLTCKIPWVGESQPLSYKDVQGGSEDL